jgi:hypothetical protein
MTISYLEFQSLEGSRGHVDKKNLIINTTFFMKKSKDLTSIPQNLMFYSIKTFYHYAKHTLVYL